MTRLLLICCFSLTGILIHAGPHPAPIPQRIITLSGALTETVDALGFGSNIVAVDVTSEFPAHIRQLPKVSRNRALSVEGILSFHPDIVLAPEGDINRGMQSQLRAAGIKLVVLHQDYSPKGALDLIRDVAAALMVPEKGKALSAKIAAQLDQATAAVRSDAARMPSVLFIYARGAGTMSVAGKGSNMDAMIRLAGGKNVIHEFSDYKSYSTEALIQANPDVILLFDFGLSSLGGKQAFLRMPGVAATRAGKNKAILEMDGPLLVNFSVRLPQAITALHQGLLQMSSL